MEKSVKKIHDSPDFSGFKRNFLKFKRLSDHSVFLCHNPKAKQ